MIKKMVHTWFLHDKKMVHTWFLHDKKMVHTWFLYDSTFFQESRIVHDSRMVLLWFLHVYDSQKKLNLLFRRFDVVTGFLFVPSSILCTFSTLII